MSTMVPPETRPSLLVRIRNAADREAWYEFSEIYRPVIVRLAQQRGLQPADAEDLAQQVLVAISGAIERWETNSSRARFRTWLRRITENAILNALTRGVPDRASGHAGMRAFLEQKPGVDCADSDLLRLELRREAFTWAAAQIRGEFHPQTWNAFWLTAVQDLDVDEVARRLNKNRGSIYAARCRVMKRLKEKVKEIE